MALSEETVKPPFSSDLEKTYARLGCLVKDRPHLSRKNAILFRGKRAQEESKPPPPSNKQQKRCELKYLRELEAITERVNSLGSREWEKEHQQRHADNRRTCRSTVQRVRARLRDAPELSVHNVKDKQDRLRAAADNIAAQLESRGFTVKRRRPKSSDTNARGGTTPALADHLVVDPTFAARPYEGPLVKYDASIVSGYSPASSTRRSKKARLATTKGLEVPQQSASNKYLRGLIAEYSGDNSDNGSHLKSLSRKLDVSRETSSLLAKQSPIARQCYFHFDEPTESDFVSPVAARLPKLRQGDGYLSVTQLVEIRRNEFKAENESVRRRRSEAAVDISLVRRASRSPKVERLRSPPQKRAQSTYLGPQHPLTRAQVPLPDVPRQKELLQTVFERAGDVGSYIRRDRLAVQSGLLHHDERSCMQARLGGASHGRY